MGELRDFVPMKQVLERFTSKSNAFRKIKHAVVCLGASLLVIDVLVLPQSYAALFFTLDAPI